MKPIISEYNILVDVVGGGLSLHLLFKLIDKKVTSLGWQLAQGFVS